MTVRAGRLSDRIEFELKTFTAINADPLGGGSASVGTWTHSFYDCAEATPTSETSMQFVMRYRLDPLGNEITPRTHRILFRGSYWTIIDPVTDQRRTSMTIRCDFSAKIEATHMRSVEREYIDGIPISRPRDQ